jgi:hypothetical protein
VSQPYEAALAKAVQSLRATNTTGWDTFMACLAGRLEHITETLVSSPSERLAEFQGRAREARELFRELAKAPELAEQLYQQERANAHASRQPQANRPQHHPPGRP